MRIKNEMEFEGEMDISESEGGFVASSLRINGMGLAELISDECGFRRFRCGAENRKFKGRWRIIVQKVGDED